MAAFSGALKSKYFDNCSRILSTQPATTSVVFRLRSSFFPLGSPISPVAPPTSAIGVWPANWKRRSTRRTTRFPTCKLGAVGSNPMYRVVGFANEATSAASSVYCEKRPRHFRSSMSALDCVAICEFTPPSSLRKRAFGRIISSRSL